MNSPGMRPPWSTASAGFSWMRQSWKTHKQTSRLIWYVVDKHSPKQTQRFRTEEEGYAEPCGRTNANLLMSRVRLEVPKVAEDV